MAGALERRGAVATLLQDRPANLLVISGLGSPTYDVAAVEDRPDNFYLWGAMGGTLAMGLGLALARPDKRILVITGDGEMLMGLGSFATIGAQKPQNLKLCVIDNEAYGETGGQATHTGQGTDLAAVAAACGWPGTMTVSRGDELPAARKALVEDDGLVLVVLKTASGSDPRVLPDRSGHAIRQSFKAALSRKQ